jgi:hypothetical protein
MYYYIIIIIINNNNNIIPLHQFLTGIGLSDISFSHASTPQQEDCCSCGIFVLAGILAHILDKQLNAFPQHVVTCFRKELFYSILQNKLIIQQTLIILGTRKRHQSPTFWGHKRKKRRKKDGILPAISICSSTSTKRPLAQSLITDIYKSTNSEGKNTKRTKLKPDNHPNHDMSKIKDRKKRKLTKKIKLKEGIFPKTYD